MWCSKQQSGLLGRMADSERIKRRAHIRVAGARGEERQMIVESELREGAQADTQVQLLSNRTALEYMTCAFHAG